jgi:hypothetical protein
MAQKALQSVLDTRDFRSLRISADVLNRASGIGRASSEVGRSAQQAAR